jgi:hypothetical protein
MILATHAIAGAAAAEIFPGNSSLAFVAAFLSHFILDAIPHWNYRLKSKVEDSSDPLDGKMIWGRKFIIDILKISLDFAAGIAFSILFFSKGADQNVAITILGALGGMLPDALQFAYWQLKVEPFKSLQKFHHWIHPKKERQLSLAVGAPLQILIAAVIIFTAGLFF